MFVEDTTDDEDEGGRRLVEMFVHRGNTVNIARAILEVFRKKQFARMEIPMSNEVWKR